MNPLKLFKIRPEERIQAIVALVVILLFNALFIYRMHELFLQEGFGPYWKVFERELHLAGYDPYTYLGISDKTVYARIRKMDGEFTLEKGRIYRHETAQMSVLEPDL